MYYQLGVIMYTCLYCNTTTDVPVLVHILGTPEVIPMCSDYCAKTLEEAQDCERIEKTDPDVDDYFDRLLSEGHCDICEGPCIEDN